MALVITLLMLSVITFLAIAFLTMSRQNKSAVSASLDVATARAASDAARARAQAEIMGQILAHGDALAYDYMVSRNYESPSFTNLNRQFDPNNVNYDRLANTRQPFSSSNNAASWAQNIANLFYDPRPPVFVETNPGTPSKLDFRFYVDIDRNGRFETNGDQPIMNDLDVPIGIGSNIVVNGEPEWIGQLRNPLYHHSGTNTFIDRYAYLVLPVGKTLDLNYIYNYLKADYANGISGPGNVPRQEDGFARDQGVGSWELNLAGMLEAISPWAYEEPANFSYAGYLSPSAGPYTYYPPTLNPSANTPNFGNAFDDASAILHYRYGNPSYGLAPLTALFPFPSNYQSFQNNNIDIYSVAAPETAPFDYSGTSLAQPVTYPWAGSYGTNLFYDPQDLFDPTKTSQYFTNRMILASQRTNTYDRYTFLRLLSTMGMGSSPEYGVWVYGDTNYITPGAFMPPLVLRTKVNLNYDNTPQITNAYAPYVAMPTNLAPWSAIGFFTNAAELLLRSKIFTFSNSLGSFTNGTIAATFGVTNIPIYRANNPGIRYDEGIHQMLQLAANIYDATQTNSFASKYGPVRHPSIFRPRFGIVNPGTTNAGINIIGYVQVTNGIQAYKQMQRNGGFRELTNVLTDLQSNPVLAADDNAWGIPWIVAAEKGLPQFNQYSYNTRALFTRKVLFVRKGTVASPVTNQPPQYTNQFYCMSISNSLGMDAWNPYPSNFTGSFANGQVTYCYITNLVTISITNNYDYGFTTVITNPSLTTTTLKGPLAFSSWNGNFGLSGGSNPNGFIEFYPSNVVTLQACYFSEANRNLVFFTNGIISSNGFLAADIHQTSWPVHRWTVNVTNHLVYALFDGTPTDGALLDFVNLGPFGSSLTISTNGGSDNSGLGTTKTGDQAQYWPLGNATDLPGSQMSAGMLYQVGNGNNDAGYGPGTPFQNALIGSNSTISSLVFGAPVDPSNVVEQLQNWVANDPIVHYTIDDLNWPGHTAPPPTTPVSILLPLTNNLGTVSARYSPWGRGERQTDNTYFKDSLMAAPTNWAFPTNKFPGVGWIGRVHRGTPWQTVYLKADNPNSPQTQGLWTNLWVKSPETYPTNDWSLVDVFTTAPNDNAARGLLAVNQTNDAAWAALFAGVIAPTNSIGNSTNIGGRPITPIADVQYLMDSQYGINNLRTNYPNGIFHKVGDILGAAALTTDPNGFLGGNAAKYSDDIVERIPQQTLGLLKVGEPQFVIFAWGQALKPKGPPYLAAGLNYGMYTNYEITGECLTRTVCHLVHTNGLKMVVDSYNVESGNP